MEVNRIFDILDYRLSVCPDAPVFFFKEEGEWKEVALAFYREQVDRLSCALLAMGMAAGDRAAVISCNSPYWNVLDMALAQIGCVSVCIARTLPADDYRYILEDCGAEYLFVDGKALLDRIRPDLAQLPNMKSIVAFRDGMGLPSIQSMLDAADPAEGAGLLAEAKQRVTPDTLFAILYTSGTTGLPKGAMLTHRNFLTTLSSLRQLTLPAFSKAISLLPLSHVYERFMNYLYQLSGCTIYYEDNYASLSKDFQEIKPDIVAVVPRVIEMMYDNVYRAGESLSEFRRRSYYRILRMAQNHNIRRPSRFALSKYNVIDRLVFSKIRGHYGGNLKTLVSAGDALQPRLSRFFFNLGVHVVEGYGLTEAGPLLALCSSPCKGDGLASFTPLPGMRVRCMGDGEIVCKGPSVMQGYVNQPELSHRIIDEAGWLHTGDLGAMDKDGNVSIVGRKASVVRLSTQTHVSPETIERIFRESPFVQDILVVGENKPYLSAVIIPDFDFLRDWQARHGISCLSRNAMLIDNPTLVRYQKVIDKYNAKLPANSQIRRFLVVDDQWSESNKCLSPTLKACRNIVTARCKKYIDELYR